MHKQQVRINLEKFIGEYNIHKDNLQNASEQTMRTWIDKFLAIFDWDCTNIMYVEQEKMLTPDERVRLKQINSRHSKPDYTLKNGRTRVNFLDAKDLNDNIKESEEIAFQVRSYGWSANLTCSIVTNIEEIAFYNCSKMPQKQDSVQLDRIYLTIDQYIENFDVLYELLYRENILNGNQYKHLNLKSDNKIKKVSLDNAFAVVLSDFRLKLAEAIFDSNKKIIGDDSELLSKIVQSIINRIMFLRICEGRKLEEEKSLLNLLNGNFWDNFKKKNKDIYEIEYGGPVFYEIRQFDDLSIDNEVFASFIDKLYDPYPYRFDVIPTELLANMYEKFISSEISIEEGIIKQMEKSFYKKQNGVVSTPKYMVDFLLDKTFKNLEKVTTLNELLDLKILEPSCGSGTFLLGILESIEEKAIELYKNGYIDKEQESLFVVVEGSGKNCYPTIELRRLIISNCIYAIDMDYQAVEVAKLSLALKCIENFNLYTYNDKFGLNKQMLLHNIGKNIIHGNTLIEYDIMNKIGDISEYADILVPLDIKNDKGFESVFGKSGKGGFDYIIGNPPYVKTQTYIDDLPYCREYFKKKYKFDDQSADMSIYFIEKCIELLNDEGKVSFLCQKRFFKTEYGENTRKYLSENNLIDTIINFEATDIFHNNTTYVCIMIFNKINNGIDTFNYLKIKEDGNELKNNLLVGKKYEFLAKNKKVLKKDGWNLCDNIKLENLILNLEQKFETLEDLKNNKICDIHGGIQVLRNDVYYIASYEFDGNRIKGRNRRKIDKNITSDRDIYVEVESDICRPIAANKKLSKFQSIQPEYYAIIPYDEKDFKPIPFSQIEKEYELCSKYLKSQEKYIRGCNKQLKPGEYWHTFTRTTNLKLYNTKKILFPMTAKEVVASYVDKPIYPDNSNMWGLHLNEPNEDIYLALTSILNSKIFSVIAIYNSNPQANGYNKMNKQFMLPTPLPYNKLQSDVDVIKRLKEYAIKLNKLVDKREKLSENPVINESKLRTITYSIDDNFKKLNNDVYNLYGLNKEEIEVVEDAYKDYLNKISKKK